MNKGRTNVTRRKWVTGTRGIGIACAAAAGMLAGGVHAQVMPPGTETFKLDLGGIINTNSTSFRLDGAGGRGTDIDLEKATGAKEDVSSFLLSGTWRVAPRHRVGLAIFAVDRNASKTIDRDITIGDTVIPISTQLTTESEAQYFIANYRYSFIKDENMEIAGLLGLYGANYKFKFAAANPVVDIDKSTVAPLPMVGLGADFYLGPRWTVSLFVEGMSLKVGDVDGSILHAGASTEYMFTRNWGVGIGYQVADVKVDVDKSDFRGHFGWRMDGYFAYLQARF